MSFWRACLKADLSRRLTPSPCPPGVGASALGARATTPIPAAQNHRGSTHWGESYLHHENLFYRTLLIAGLTSHRRLTGSDQYMGLLRDQVQTLSAEIDASPHGLLDDYPGQCYPTDVVFAIAAIRHADTVLGTDHRAFVDRSARAFAGPLLDPVGLPPYAADAVRGVADGRSRGCGDAFLLTFVPELWPEMSSAWYRAFEQHYWQRRWSADGFREFPKDMHSGDWFMDVDSGPVLAGHGFAASAFGIGAARANGRFDHAYALSIEGLALSWPLFDGTLLTPRVLSNAVDAPYLGEAAMVFALTRQPVRNGSVRVQVHTPPFVYVLLCLYTSVAVIFVWGAISRLVRVSRRRRRIELPRARLQWLLLGTLLLCGVLVAVLLNTGFGAMVLLAAQLLPRDAPLTARE